MIISLIRVFDDYLNRTYINYYASMIIYYTGSENDNENNNKYYDFCSF